MVRQAVVDALYATVMCLAATSLCGCTHRTKETPDPVLEQLRSFRPKNAAEKERQELAISLRQNGVVDSQPVLLTAFIRDDMDLWDRGTGPALGLTLYDEAEDVLGCVIREERVASDGSRQVLVEKYPVFLFYPTDGPLQPRYFPIQVRTSDQRKDDQQWEKYTKIDLRDKISPGGGMKCFIDTLPPVYASIPKPNYVDVLVSLYDRAGHESVPVEPRYTPQQEKAASK